MLTFKQIGILLALLSMLGASAWAVPPGVPTQFSAQAGNASAVLLWTPPATGSVSKYVIYSNTTVVAETDTSYLANALVNGTPYTFSVTAVNATNEESGHTPEITVIPAVVPQAPTGVTATVTTSPSAQIQLQWNAVVPQSAPIAGYTVYRALSGTTQTLTTFSTATTWIDTAINTLNAFGSYYYQVAAVDQWGNTGLASASLFVSTAQLAPTYTLPQITVTPADGQLTLTWTPSMLVDIFQVNLLKVSDNSLTVQYTSNSYTSSAVFFVPNDGEAYYASVAPIFGGNFGTPVSVLARAFPPTIPTPTILSGNQYIQLNWSPLSATTGVTAYNIYGDASPSPTTLLFSAPATQSSFLYPTTNTQYYSIRAVNSAGECPHFLTVTAAPTGTLPLPPQNFSISLGVSHTLIFSWTANSTNDALTHYRLVALDGPFPSLELPATVTTTAVGALTNGQSYRFFLTAKNAGGESPASLTLTAAPMAAPISALTSVQSNAVLLTWSEGDTLSGVANYQLFRTDSLYTHPVLLTTTAQTGFIDRLTASGDYYYRLNAQNNLGQILPEALAPSLTAKVLYPPTPPDTFRLTPGDGQIQILWRKITTPSSVTTYNIYRSTVSGAYTLPIMSNIPSKDTFITDSTGLTNTSRYFYTLTCVNDAGESTRSAEYWAIPYKPASLPNDSTLHTTHERRQIQLHWSSALPGDYPIIGYNLYRSTDGGGTFTLTGSNPASIPQPSATLYIDNDINYGTVYLYRLHPVDFDSTYALYHEGPAYALARVDVEYPNNRLDVLRNAFNPAKGESAPIQLMQVQPGRTWIKIYNLAGEHIRTLWDDEVAATFTPDFPFILATEWDGKNFRGETVASGVYLIHCEGQSHYHQTRKVAVIK